MLPLEHEFRKNSLERLLVEILSGYLNAFDICILLESKNLSSRTARRGPLSGPLASLKGPETSSRGRLLPPPAAHLGHHIHLIAEKVAATKVENVTTTSSAPSSARLNQSRLSSLELRSTRYRSTHHYIIRPHQPQVPHKATVALIR